MFRASTARSIAAIFTSLSILSSAFLPVLVNAQATNVCITADTMCTPDKSGKVNPTPCVCAVVGYYITGVCAAPQKCQALAISMNGTSIPLSQSGLTSAQLADMGVTQTGGGLLGGLSTSNMMQYGMLGMMGISAISSLSSLFGGSGSQNNSSSQTTGVCTTQYFYTSDTTQLTNPCAIYSPTNTSSTSNVTPTTCIQWSQTCPAGETPSPGGSDMFNCPLPPVCSPSPTQPTSSSTTPTNCVAPVPPICAAGFVAQSAGTDTHGCALPGTCVPQVFVSSTTLGSTASSSLFVVPTSFLASPLGGRVPLLVTFSGEANGPYSIDFDDGSPGFSFTCGGAPCGSNAINQSHTYSADGIYKIDMNDTTGKYSQTVTVSTQNATGTAAGGCTSWNVQCQAGYQLQDNGVGSNGCQLQPTCTPTPPGYAPGFGPGGSNLAYTTTVYYDDTTGSATPPPSQTALNQKTPTLPPPGQGLHGDLLSAGGGATIQATSVNGNSAVSGFFGIAGNATNLCLSRPWANNFLSYIIPPSFFDNICSLAGYPVGVVQAPGGGQASTNVSVAPPQQQTTQYQTSSQAQAKIWANPASVSLGGRTTIFWTTQGVTSCVESSSDGNFSGNSTSGGASTVALSGPVTFTIKCNTPTGTPITNSATVTIGN